jgi:hypothetical protein
MPVVVPTAATTAAPRVDSRLAFVLEFLQDMYDAGPPNPLPGAMSAIVGAVDWNMVDPGKLAAIVALLMADSIVGDEDDGIEDYDRERRVAIVEACLRTPNLRGIREEARRDRARNRLAPDRFVSAAKAAHVLRGGL